jgi:hypothetical protein
MDPEKFVEDNNNDPKCVRLMRKKFKCLIIFMLLIISCTQLLVIIFEKLDQKYLNRILELISSQNSTFLTPPKNEEASNSTAR